jgi:catechol 2,3-dioxygenase-like lactoylglutathione lyase family enzyme
MTDQSPFSTSIIHHPGLRIEDAEAGKRWLTTMLGFRVEHEFEFAGHDFVWLSAGGSKFPVVELIGGPLENERQPVENIAELLKIWGWQHVCLQVHDLEACMRHLRARGVTVLIDVIEGAPGIAFIVDPWGNVYELLEHAHQEQGGTDHRSTSPASQTFLD